MSIILDPSKSFITIQIYYTYSQSEGYKIVPESNRNKEVLNTTWKRITWQEQNVIISRSLRSLKGTPEMDPLKFRDLKLKTCLKQWDAITEDGDPIPCTPEMIDNLDPVLANDLLKKYESACEPLEDELKELERSARRFYEGKKPLQGIFPQYIHEHIIAKTYHWSLKEIRDMEYYDFLVHLHLCLVSDEKEKEFELTAHGREKKRKLTADEILRKKATQST